MKVITLLVSLCLAGCITSEYDASTALSKQGFKAIIIEDFAPLSCGQDDFVGRHFAAMNINNEQVTGVVCCGLFKGCTIRW